METPYVVDRDLLVKVLGVLADQCSKAPEFGSNFRCALVTLQSGLYDTEALTVAYRTAETLSYSDGYFCGPHGEALRRLCQRLYLMGPQSRIPQNGVKIQSSLDLLASYPPVYLPSTDG